MLAQQSGAPNFSTGKNQFWRENPNHWLTITRLYLWTPPKSAKRFTGRLRADRVLQDNL
jgi:hypothetical protein